MVELVTVGEITLDDVVFLDDTVRRRMLGGGSLYSAEGARVWHPSVGVNSITGDEHYERTRERINERGIDTAGITSIPGNGIELWLLHETDTAKQQVPKLSSRQYTELDPRRGPLPESYRRAGGFHIAPQSVEGQRKGLEAVRELEVDPVVTLDLQADEFIDTQQYRRGEFLHRCTAFLPSIDEVDRIWNPPNLPDWIRTVAERGLEYVAVKLGSEGSLAYVREEDEVYDVPAYPSEVADTTGAGDAFCGGVLAGLYRGKPFLDAVAMGTVSASYVVETFGALNTGPEPEDRDERFRRVRRKVGPHSKKSG